MSIPEKPPPHTTVVTVTNPVKNRGHNKQESTEEEKNAIVPSSKNNFTEFRGYNVGLDSNTPLWYYVLKEAELMEQGLRLGPVGSLIVGEVFIGLLQLAPGSYLRDNPGFRPTLPSRVAGNFTMVDLLTYAQVDPASRGQ